MATIRQRKNGKWQAIVRRQGIPPAARCFQMRQDAERWARQLEAEIDRGTYVNRSEAERTTIACLMDRYLAEVTPLKRSADREHRRFGLLRRHFGAFSPASLQAKHIAAFRDERLSKGIAGSTVVKEIASLSHLLDVAIKDWSLPLPSNPARMVRKPKQPPGRNRRLAKGEEEALLAACGQSKASMLAPLVLLALETAMRLGELIALEWRNINLTSRTAILPLTKNGDARIVPLSPKALEVVATIPRNLQCPRLFWTWARSDSAEHAWKRAVTLAGLPDLRFHDLRHEATSRLFERGLGVMEVAAITGHKSLSMLRRYTHLRAEDLALKLAA